MFMYAKQLADKRRRAPRDDIITALLDAEVDGDPLSEMDFNLFFLLLAVAGNETTRNSISHGMNAFCDNPDQYQLLVAGPDARCTSATEEIVRWASPVMYFRRNVTQDTELRGQQLKAGDKVSIWYISANRDEDDLRRPVHVRHHARPRTSTSASAAAVRTTASAPTSPAWRSTCCSRRWRGASRRIELAGDAPERLRSNFIGGIKHLPVRFHA